MKKIRRAMSCGCLYEPAELYVKGEVSILSQGACQELGQAMVAALDGNPENDQHPDVVRWHINAAKHKREIHAHPEWNE